MDDVEYDNQNDNSANKKYAKRKNIFFDSNDEMYYESELSEESALKKGKK
jgi:hypothetical protein